MVNDHYPLYFILSIKRTSPQKYRNATYCIIRIFPIRYFLKRSAVYYFKIFQTQTRSGSNRIFYKLLSLSDRMRFAKVQLLNKVCEIFKRILSLHRRKPCIAAAQCQPVFLTHNRTTYNFQSVEPYLFHHFTNNSQLLEIFLAEIKHG